jgi:hypothetical protein
MERFEPLKLDVKAANGPEWSIKRESAGKRVINARSARKITRSGMGRKGRTGFKGQR